jgi:peptide/nickel transport system substrate-binding protein
MRRAAFLTAASTTVGIAAATLATVMFLTEAEPAYGAGITLAWEAEPRAIDPRYAVDANSQYLENLLHCSIIDFDKDGKTVADLAKGWTWAGPTTLEVELKPGVTYSDGTPVTADDVRATYAFFATDAKTPSPRKGAFANVKSVAAKGNVVTFELTAPDSTFVTNLVVGILPAKLAGQDMISDKAGIVGCGPFTLKDFGITGIELARNPNYKLGTAAKSDSVTIKFVKDEITRFAKLQAGELDIVQNAINRDKLGDIAKKNPGLKIFKRPGLNTTYLGFNMRDKLAGNIAVRQAISHAIDKQKIIKYVMNGLAVPASTMLTPTDPYIDAALAATPYDVSKAKAILDAAGFKDPDGKEPRFKLTYKTTTDLTRVAIAKAIASDLKQVGIDVTVEPLEWGRFKSDVEAGKVQMWSLSWVGFKDPDIYRFAFATESFPPNGGNRGWYTNPELDKLLAEARSKTADADRKAAYAKVQKIVATELPYVFLWHEEIFAVVNKNVEGFELYADGRYASLTEAYKK